MFVFFPKLFALKNLSKRNELIFFLPLSTVLFAKGKETRKESKSLRLRSLILNHCALVNPIAFYVICDPSKCNSIKVFLFLIFSVLPHTSFNFFYAAFSQNFTFSHSILSLGCYLISNVFRFLFSPFLSITVWYATDCIGKLEKH